MSPFEITTAVLLKIQISPYFTPYRVVNNNLHKYVERSYWLQQNDGADQEECLDCSNIKTETKRCVETSVNIYQMTRRNISDELSAWLKFIKV